MTKRRLNPELELIQYLSRSFERPAGLPRSRGVKDPFQRDAKTQLGLRIRREHSLAVQALVIFLRFGSLQSDSRRIRSSTEVFWQTGVKVQS